MGSPYALCQHGLGWVAWQINKMIAYQTAKKAKKYRKDRVKVPKIFERIGLTSKNGLIIGSSPRFNVYGNDFGWERPIVVWTGVGN